MTTFKNQWVKLFLCMLLGTLSTVVYGKASSVVTPVVLRGVWYPQSEQGHEQCKAYRENKSIDNLIGALVIWKRSYRSYAEYGEGNYSVIRKIKRLKAATWEIQDTTYLDGNKYGNSDSSIFSIKNTQLHWTYRFTVENKETKHTAVLFKCKA